MTPQQKINSFSKFLAYILERHPEEFGLLPDAEGYVRTKELLQAMSESEGWRHIRESNIKELLLVVPDPPVEVEGNQIRARNREHLPTTGPCMEPPKLLYTCVRRKAYPAVSKNGIRPAGHSHVICTPDKEMAERIGRRKDPSPVLLTIHTSRLDRADVSLHQFTDTFYLAEYIPTGIFTGPSLPKESLVKEKPEPKPKKKPAEAGSFNPTPDMIDGDVRKNKGKKKKLDWKQDRKHSRRKKDGGWPDA